ncbi:MAG: hypothetical protein ACYDGM_12800 [Vulcanimicrobiaceae bacterium]
MIPTAITEKQTILTAQRAFGIDPLQALLFQALNEKFGATGWAVNEDPRFRSELDCHPIDIIAPIEQHETLLDTVVTLQAELSRKHDINVYFVLTEPN